ncbi:MAG: NYN domain-containing protein [Spirochaetia bacterium]|nr:NYN domain-containing protein [Spirochaetia bacterium]
MILLVDAFNLIYKFPDLEEKMYRGDLTEARRGLLDLLMRYKKSWKKKIELHVFFDGKKKHGDETRKETVSGMETYFSIDLSADHLIKEFIKRNPSPGNLTVITSDKDILFFAKKFKCPFHTSEEFSKTVQDLLSSQTEINVSDDKPEDTEDVSFWMDMFKNRKRN